MYFHNIIYIKCPLCKICVQLDSKFNFCYVCGRAINILEINDLKYKQP